MTQLYTVDDAVDALQLTPGSDGQYVGHCLVHDDNTPSLSVSGDPVTGNLLTFCHACVDQKRVFQAVIDRIHESKAELGGNVQETRADSDATQGNADTDSMRERREKIAVNIWEESSIRADNVSKYLMSRGLSGSVTDSIREAELEHSIGSGKFYYTMVAAVEDLDGHIRGIHRTFLEVDPSGKVQKADVETPKKSLGFIKSCAVHLSDDYSETLHLTEGIETGISVFEAVGGSVWSVLSAKNLSAVKIPDHVEQIYIWADKDRSGTGEKFAKIAAEQFIQQGKKAYFMMPEAEIPSDQKSLDWLDMGATEIVSALATATEFVSDPTGMPWCTVKMPNRYSIGALGVFHEKEKADGEIQQIPVSTGAVWLSGSRVDLATRETEHEVSWFVRNRNSVMRRWVNRGQLSKRSTLLEMSELEGFPIYDGIAGEAVKYIALLEQENNLPTTLIARKPGWNQNISGEMVFITGQNNPGILFHPEAAYQTYANALSSEGKYDEWLRAIRQLMTKFPIVLFSVLATLAAPLLRLIDAPNFAVDFWGRTSSGKTTLLQVLASIWGKPSGSGGLILSWNNTVIFSERLASFFGGGFSVFFDDSQTASDRLVEIVTYMLVNGMGKGRAKPYSVAKTEAFQVVLFTTGEKPLTENSYPGAKARVIEIFGSPFPGIAPQELHQLKGIIMKNYGFLGERYISALSNVNTEDLRTRFLEARDYYSEKATNDIGQRFSAYFAATYLAGAILASKVAEMEWLAPIFVNAIDTVWEQTTVSMAETDMAQKALVGVASWVESNRLHFSTSKGAITFQPIFGAIKESEGYVAIIPHVFKQALVNLGIPSADAVLTEWMRRDWLIYTPGRKQKQIKIDSRPVWCVCISLAALYSVTENIDVVETSCSETPLQDFESLPQPQPHSQA